MISQGFLDSIEWWQDLGDGIILTYRTATSTLSDFPNWHVSIDFCNAAKLGHSGDMDLLVFEDKSDWAFLSNGPKYKDDLSGITLLLYERLMEAVR